jgi:hypothetical protein
VEDDEVLELAALDQAEVGATDGPSRLEEGLEVGVVRRAFAV